MQRTVTAIEKEAFLELDIIARQCKTKQDRLARYEIIRNKANGVELLQKVLEVMNAEWLVRSRQIERELDSLHREMSANPTDEDAVNYIWRQIQEKQADSRLKSYTILTGELSTFIRANPVKLPSVNHFSFNGQ